MEFRDSGTADHAYKAWKVVLGQVAQTAKGVGEISCRAVQDANNSFGCSRLGLAFRRKSIYACVAESFPATRTA